MGGTDWNQNTWLSPSPLGSHDYEEDPASLLSNGKRFDPDLGILPQLKKFSVLDPTDTLPKHFTYSMPMILQHLICQCHLLKLSKDVHT